MYKYIVSFTAIAIFSTGVAAGHPSDGYEANPLPRPYTAEGHGFTSNWSTGDLQFPAEFPKAGEMSPAEKYIVSGSQNSSYGFGLRPWKSLVYNAVAMIYAQTGSIPEVLDEDAIVSMTGGVFSAGDPRIDEYRSPISGDFPSLNAGEFSAGDVYIRPLTLFEMDKYASLDPFYRELWKNDRVWNHAEQEWQYESLLGQVFYMRIYGEEDVLVAGLFFSSSQSVGR
ncbi:MAG: hypothetical protein R3F46_15045 [bacterium]